MSIGEKLKELRKKDNRSLKAQGKELGVSMNAIYRWEHDICAPRKTSLKKIVKLHNISLKWLLDDDAVFDDLDKAAKCDDGDCVCVPPSKRKRASVRQLVLMYRELPEEDKYLCFNLVERIHANGMTQ